jgi:sporulation protein YlmC with PRC-barrel domain
MMRANRIQLYNLPVETESGIRLGRVVDVEVDPESHIIHTYLVRPSRLTHPLVRGCLRVGRSQVIAIQSDRIIVEDAAGSARYGVTTARQKFSKNIAPAVPARAG